MSVIYRGVFTRENGFQVWRNDNPLDPKASQKVWNHSPDGFAWGYQGSGPAQLALALLLDAGVPRCQAVRLHQSFKRAMVAAWRNDEGEMWVLPQQAILGWVRDF